MNEKFRSVISHSQDDKVKIIYSWFGPKGPLWNTELPNILTFASTAEGVPAYLESRNFWTDDIWEKQFSKATDKYELRHYFQLGDDERLKDDIQPIKNPLDKINSISMDAIGISTHHDSITGTSIQTTVFDLYK